MSTLPQADQCNAGTGAGSTTDEYLGLRIAAIFIILVASTAGALFPVLLKRRSSGRGESQPVSPRVLLMLNFAKYFGSGVIIGTSFIHLLAPGIEALGSPCLSEEWGNYPYALGLCLFSILVIFLVEATALRWGEAHMAKIQGVNLENELQLQHQAGPEEVDLRIDSSFPDSGPTTADTGAHIIGIAILEFGAILHSVLIGLTLATNQRFKVLFVVIVLHQMFEGLGIGSRLASADFPGGRSSYIPILAAVVFGLSTPLGLTVGLILVVRRSYYSPESDAGALILSGVLDSLSAGILIYTGLVELLAHEILFNKGLMKGRTMPVVYAVLWVFLGCSVMALLGKWV